ncbi:MAG: hypothetical protein QXF76_01585 [Candidatus Anstonellales archaeon]
MQNLNKVSLDNRAKLFILIFLIILCFVLLFLYFGNNEKSKVVNNKDIRTSLIGLQNAKNIVIVEELDSDLPKEQKSAIISCAIDLTTSLILGNLVNENNLDIIAYDRQNCLMIKDNRTFNYSLNECENQLKEQNAFAIYLKPKRFNEENEYYETRMLIYVPQNYTDKCQIIVK